MSRTSTARLAPRAAPTIVVTTARSPVPAWNPSQAPTSAPPSAAQRPIVRACGRSRSSPREVDAQADRHADREDGEERVVERQRRERDERDDEAGEPAAEPEHDRVQRPEQDARLAADPAAPARAAPHQQQREERRAAGRPSIVPAKPLPSAVCVTLRREVDLRRRVERRVDLAAVEERVQEPRARLRLLAPERGRVAELRRARPGGRSGGAAAAPGSRYCGGVAKSSVPPTSSVSTFESRTRVYSFSSGVGRPGVRRGRRRRR